MITSFTVLYLFSLLWFSVLKLCRYYFSISKLEASCRLFQNLRHTSSLEDRQEVRCSGEFTAFVASNQVIAILSVVAKRLAVLPD